MLGCGPKKKALRRSARALGWVTVVLGVAEGGFRAMLSGGRLQVRAFGSTLLGRRFWVGGFRSAVSGRRGPAAGRPLWACGFGGRRGAPTPRPTLKARPRRTLIAVRLAGALRTGPASMLWMRACGAPAVPSMLGGASQASPQRPAHHRAEPAVVLRKNTTVASLEVEVWCYALTPRRRDSTRLGAVRRIERCWPDDHPCFGEWIGQALR